MGQKTRDDKVGQLTYSAGNILMAATTSSPAYLTIGGQQYTVTSQLSVALPSLSAAVRYQIYAVQTSGVVSLVISTNENSTGPSGFSSWKLVGSFRADGQASVGFGSFINIKGVPTTQRIAYNATLTGFGTPTLVSFFFEQFGQEMRIQGTFTAGTNNSVLFSTNLPGAWLIDGNSLSIQNTTANPGPTVAGVWTAHTANPQRCNALTATATDAGKIYLGANATPLIPNATASTMASSVVTAMEAVVPIQGWNNTAIEEL